MKKIIQVSLVLLMNSPVVFAGQVVYKNMYSQVNLVQGRGNDVASSTKDAQSSVPIGYVTDPGNSPEVECLDSKGEMTPIESCLNDNSVILTTIPIIKIK